MIYSFSTLTMYESCPYSFYLRKIERTEGERNGYAEIGTYAHGILEKLLKKEMTFREALDDCVENFHDYITDPYMKESTVDAKYLSFCDYLSDLNEKVLDGYQIVSTEQKLWWDLDGHKMCGVADLLLRNEQTGKLVLVDHKSSPHYLKKNGEPLKSQLENFTKYKKQMYLYAYAIHQKYGEYPETLAWNHFLDGGSITAIPFKEEDLKETLAWAKGIIEKIENDHEYLPDTSNYLQCYVYCDYRNGICEYKGLDPDEEDYAELS